MPITNIVENYLGAPMLEEDISILFYLRTYTEICILKYINQKTFRVPPSILILTSLRIAITVLPLLLSNFA